MDIYYLHYKHLKLFYTTSKWWAKFSYICVWIYRTC